MLLEARNQGSGLREATHGAMSTSEMEACDDTHFICNAPADGVPAFPNLFSVLLRWPYLYGVAPDSSWALDFDAETITPGADRTPERREERRNEKTCRLKHYLSRATCRRLEPK